MPLRVAQQFQQHRVDDFVAVCWVLAVDRLTATHEDAGSVIGRRFPHVLDDVTTAEVQAASKGATNYGLRTVQFVQHFCAAWVTNPASHASYKFLAAAGEVPRERLQRD